MSSIKDAQPRRSDSPLGVRKKVRAVSRKTKAKITQVTQAAPKLDQVQATAVAMAENITRRNSAPQAGNCNACRIGTAARERRQRCW